MSGLIGREPITALLASVWRRTCDGSGGVVVLTGGPAIGKSSVLAWVLEHVGSGGIGLVSRGGTMRSPMAVAGELVALLDPVGADTGEHADGSTDHDGSPGRGADRVGEHVDPVVAADKLRGLLERAGAQGPTAVVVDDLHDMDPASRTAFNLALRGLTTSGLLVVIAGRPTEEVRSFAEGFELVDVAPLAPDDARELLVASSPVPIAAPVADRLLAVADGNPLALVHLPRNLDAEHLAGTRLLPDPIPLGGDLRDAFARPLAALGPAARSMVEIAAVTSDASWSAICTVLEAPPEEPLSELEAAGLARVEAGRLVLDHPLLRSAAIAGMSGRRRRELNAALADVEELPWDVRLLHKAHSAVEPDDDLVDELVAVAEAMATRGGAEGAARMLDRAVSLTRLDERRQWLRVAAADALAVAGSTAAARHRLQEVRDEVGAGPWQVETTIRLARLDALNGDPVGAWNRLRECAAVAPGDAQGPLHAAMAVPLGMLGLVREILETSTTAVAHSTEPTPAGQVARVIQAHAIAALDESGVRGSLAEVLPRLDLGAAIDHDPLFALHIGRSLALAEMDAEAFDALTDLTARSRRSGARVSLAMSLGALGELLVRTCRYDEAAIALDDAVALSMATGQRAFAPFWFALRARLFALRGDPDAAEADLALGLRIADDLSLMGARYFLQGTVGVAALTRGEPDAAVAALEQCRFFEDAGGVLAPNLGRWRPDLVDAYVATGRLEAAEGALAPLQEAARRPGASRWTRASAARVSAGLVASTDAAAAVALLRSAVELYDPDRDRFDRARAQLALAELLLRTQSEGAVPPAADHHGRRADSDEATEQSPAAGTPHERATIGPLSGTSEDISQVLAHARFAFTSLGAVPWVSRVDALSTRPGGATGLDLLTAGELRILAEASNGLTNREIAARLHLSPKTVANHLSRIYRKLDVLSRTEAAHLYLMR